MLFGFNLNDLFIFPIRDQEARKHFLVGCLLYLAGFIIPIVPWLIVAGYNAILIRQVLNGEQPHLVKWKDWEALLKDGARVAGIRLIFMGPLLILFGGMMILFLVFPLSASLFENGDSQVFGTLYVILMMIFTASMVLVMPLSLAIGLLAPAAEIHMLAKDDFSAGFQFREWWPIFKQNWGGFVVALAILYGISMVTSFAMQILLMTFILICLLPFFLAAISMYSGVIQYVAYAKAYKDGQEKLALSTTVA